MLDDCDKCNIISYVGIILVTGSTRKECLDRTKRALSVIECMGFKVSTAKAQLVQQSIKYLRLELRGDGRILNAQRADLVCKLPAPTDTTTLRSFPGMVGFIREFTINFAEIAALLYHLLNKGVP